MFLKFRGKYPEVPLFSKHFSLKEQQQQQQNPAEINYNLIKITKKQYFKNLQNIVSMEIVKDQLEFNLFLLLVKIS